MRIVIDFQGAQTESRFRGVGRYVRDLVLALTHHAVGHEVWLVLNSAFPESIFHIQSAFQGRVPKERIRVFDVLTPVAENDPENHWRARAAEQIREYFIQQLNPDVVLVTSLFEGYCDDAVTSIKSFSKNLKTAVILYDLIPLLHSDQYLSTPEQKAYYHRKIEWLKRADLLLTISEYSRREAIEALGLPVEKAVNISGAASVTYQRENLTADRVEALLRRLHLDRKIILCVPGGGDARKNLEGLIQAYGLVPEVMRAEHQLVIASRLDDVVETVEGAILNLGLAKSDVVLTGYLEEEELGLLYSQALFCVAPSKYEGFCLPALEAMVLGVPVIASNSTSIPEVVGYDEALFDPLSPQSMADKIQQAMQEEDFRHRLREHGLSQAKKFSWDESAKRALSALEKLSNSAVPAVLERSLASKPRLAMVTPLPPERTGIADYSIELLPELRRHFEIELVVAQPKVDVPANVAALPVRNLAWFKEHAHEFDHIVYQMGNSPFHSHMFELLQHYPGAVVMHDFFLSGVLAYEEIWGLKPQAWTHALYYSHGYAPLQKRLFPNGVDEVRNVYPCNLVVLQGAQGIISHSQYSKKLAEQWYDESITQLWQVIPQLRVSAKPMARNVARRALGIKEDAFLVCSFGILDPAKCNLDLLKAWLASTLGKKTECELVFVGENHGGEYGAELSSLIRSNKHSAIKITGWVSPEAYQQYLSAADVAVQLRSLSRGETSRAVLDCMAYGLPTIVNANGAMAELSDQAVYKIPDQFKQEALTAALEKLNKDPTYRQALGATAKTLVETIHNPAQCALHYVQALKNFDEKKKTNQHGLLQSLIALPHFPVKESTLKQLAQTLALAVQRPHRQLLVDVSNMVRQDLRTGIERVVRAQLLELLQSPPAGFRVEPVYLVEMEGDWHYRYARSYTSQLLDLNCPVMADQAIDIGFGDIFYALDYAPGDIVNAAKAGVFSRFKAFGVEINVEVYDLLPVLRPDFFPEGADESHAAWLQESGQFADRLIGISRSVVDELYGWFEKNPPQRLDTLKLAPILLGADLEASQPTRGKPKDAPQTLLKIKNTKSFLMVGTLEPRKGHLQVLEAFEKLWRDGHDLSLVIIGKEGWKHLPEKQRRTIPQLVHKLRHHPELGRRLFWFEKVSDEYLQEIYRSATCLITASEGEGFGLPLIEAARHKLPIVARDLPVFKEVAGEHAYYFKGLHGTDLASAIVEWLTLESKNVAPSSEGMAFQTWSEVGKQLSATLLNQKEERLWAPPLVKKKAFDEHLHLIHSARIIMTRRLLPEAQHIVDLGGANCPLYKMGYPYSFKKLVMIDLPPDERHEYYKDVAVEEHSNLGEVVIRYADMTNLEGIADESVDFVWSGQSIEHVPYDQGVKMCHEAYRVLKKGGAFCLDTPNRYITQIHTQDAGGGFIHPEHYIEYYPEQLVEVLQKAGFDVKQSYGICEMPRTAAAGEFCYEDFLHGNQITTNVKNAYIQFHHCVKQ